MAETPTRAETMLRARAAALRPAMVALALDRLGDPDAAHDVAQDALEAALRHLGELRDHEALGPWLRAITLNQIRQAWRRLLAAERVLPEPDPPSEAAHRAAVRRALLREVLAALRELPENNRLALVMHAVHGLSYHDIADFLGVPLTTVEGRIHRARRELRRELADWLADALSE